MSTNNIIHIKLTGQFKQDHSLDKLFVECHPKNEGWGMHKNTADLLEMAEEITYETVMKHGVMNPVYEYELDKGSYPLKKVKKYSDYKTFTDKPPEDIVNELKSLIDKKTQDYILKKQAKAFPE